jgi:hypothetical protein
VTPEQQFENELEIFRTDRSAVFLRISDHTRVARDHPAVHRLLNRTPLFWNNNLGALQTGHFMEPVFSFRNICYE